MCCLTFVSDVSTEATQVINKMEVEHMCDDVKRPYLGIWS